MKTLLMALGLTVLSAGAASAEWLLVVSSNSARVEARVYDTEQQLDAEVQKLAETKYRDSGGIFTKHQVNLTATRTEQFEYRLQRVAR